MIDATNYLDLGNLFFNELIGDVMLALFVGYIIIAVAGANSKFSWQAMVMFCLLWTTIVFAYSTGLLFLWVFVALITGLLLYYTISKVVGRVGG